MTKSVTKSIFNLIKIWAVSRGSTGYSSSTEALMTAVGKPSDKLL